MKESVLLSNLRLELSKRFHGRAVFWRNNCGFNAVAKVKYGLCNGSADLIGCVAGIFVAIETKKPGGKVHEPDQKLFKAVVESHGVVYALVDNVEDGCRVVEQVIIEEDSR